MRELCWIVLDGANSHSAVQDQSYVGRGATQGSSGATRRPSADTHNLSGGPNRFRNNPKSSGVPGRTHAEPRTDGTKSVANNNGLSTGKDDGRGDLNASAAPSGGVQKRGSETEIGMRQAASTANNGTAGKSRPTSPPPPIENSFSKSSSLVNGQ